MAVEPAGIDVVGRDQELHAVDEFVASLASGPRALLLAGDAGIGKTTLWRRAVDACRASGCRVLVATPAESERDLPFAGLHDLVEPLLDESGSGLSEPRREALDTALLRSPVRTPTDRLAVSLAVRDLLAAAAGTAPIVLAVDDVQWLDSPSAVVVRFALRRLPAEPVTLVCTSRSPAPADLLGLVGEQVVRIVVGPLSIGALGRLVAARTGVRLARPTLLRLESVSGGNPFFAIEIASALRGTSSAAEPLPVPQTLADLVQGRLDEFSQETRDALLAVAALGHPPLSLLAAAVPRCEKIVGEAIEAGVLELDGGCVRFIHPILASTVYSNVLPERRQAAHRALAEVVEDPEQRALHLARGSVDPDEEVAATLEAAAVQAAARGAPETAAELAEHARRLTPAADADAAARRALAAAEYTWSAGDGARSRELVLELIDSLEPSPARARARQLLVKIVDDIRDTIAQLELALAEAAGDPVLGASIRNLLARQRMWAGHCDSAVADARAGAALAERAGARAELAAALSREATARVFAGGERTPHELLARAVALEQQLERPLPVGESPTFLRGACALWDDDLETARACVEQVDRRAASLAVSWRTVVLARLAEIDLRSGQTALALRHAREAVEIGEHWGVVHAEAAALAVAALVEVVLGHEDAARESARRVLEVMRPAGYEIVVREAEHALGLLELSLGNAAAAHEVLGPLLARAPIGSPPVAAAAPDEIEALLELGRVEEARSLLERLEACAAETGRARTATAAARCRALIAAGEGDLAGAAQLAATAVGLHEGFPDPFERGRTLLVQGIIERRQKQKAAARRALEAALECFEFIGARLWAERARAELRRTGLRQVERHELTPTEQEVARRAAAGATNREIAEQMFVAVKTVEANLSRVYGKLGIRSRTELAALLSSRSP